MIEFLYVLLTTVLIFLGISIVFLFIVYPICYKVFLTYNIPIITNDDIRLDRMIILSIFWPILLAIGIICGCFSVYSYIQYYMLTHPFKRLYTFLEKKYEIYINYFINY